MNTMVQEFHLSVTHLHDNEVYIRVERKEKGITLAEEQVSWPIEKWLAQARQVFTDPLSEFFQASPEDPYEMIPVDPLSSASGLPTEPALIALGQELHEALFQGTVRDSWVMAQGVAQHRQERLRLRLGLKGDLLTRLPWEVLHAGNRPIAASDDVMFSRTQGKLNPVASIHERLSAQPSLSTSLHILMVLAAPTDQANLELKREALQLREELQSHRSSDSRRLLPDIQLTLLEQPGREQLTQELERADYQVFHFAGHSSPGPSGGLLHLVNAGSGLTESLSGDDLAGLLANNGIHLAVLNSCLGTQAATSNEFDLQGERTLAEALIRRGIPGVLAMAERIPDQVALTLSRLFYRNLKFGQPLDLSLCRARQGLISAYGSNQLYWALPILYLQSDFEGCLVEASDIGSDASQNLNTLSTDTDGLPGELPGGTGFQAVEPTMANTGGPTYRGGGGAIADLPALTDVTDDSLLLSRPDPEITNAVTRLEEDLIGEGLSVSRPIARDDFNQEGSSESASSNLSRTTDESELVLHPETSTVIRSSSEEQGRSLQGATVVDAASSRRLQLLASGPVVWLMIGAVGMLLLGGGGWMVSRLADSQRPALPRLAETAAGNPQGQVDDIAIGLANQDFEQVLKALKTLLDERRPDTAATAISGGVVNREQLETAGEEMAAEFDFLVGRINWQQFTQRGPVNDSTDPVSLTAPVSSPNEKLNAAASQWENLVDRFPGNLPYRNAYGFALLAQGSVIQAEETFRETAELLRKPDAQVKLENRDDEFQAYAGWSLSLLRLSKAENVGQQKPLLERSIKVYKRIVAENRQDYSLNALNRDFERTWLWTAEMLEDWQALENHASSR